MFQQWRAMSIYWFSSLMKLRRRLIHQLYLWLQRHISMYFHTSYSFFSRKKLSIQKTCNIIYFYIFQKKIPALFEYQFDRNWWGLLFMECHLYQCLCTNTCMHLHPNVCAWMQIWVHNTSGQGKKPYQIVGLILVLTYMYMCER